MIWRNASPTRRSEPVTRGAPRWSSRRAAGRRHGCRARRAGRRRSEAVDRGVVELPVAACARTRPASVSITTATVVGDGVRHADELEPNGPSSTGSSSGLDLAELGASEEPVLVELRLNQAEGQPRRPDLGHADLAQQVRERAHVILVRVREDRPRARCPACSRGSTSPGGSGRRRGARRAGRRRPASTTSDAVARCSNTVMFFPTSPSPPSGMILRACSGISEV